MTGTLKLATLRTLRTLGVLALCRRLTRHRLRVLAYHGFELVDEAAFRPAMFMKRETFKRRLQLIQRMGFQVVTLDAAVGQLQRGQLAHDQLVITIDDGWASFAMLAQPELQRHGFPSTLYVTSYYVQHPSPVFTMVVQYLFWKASSEVIDFRGVPWAPGGTVLRGDAATLEQVMWQAILHGEQHCDQPQRDALCADLGRRLGVPYQDIASSRRFHLMTPQELCAAQSAGVAIELHTHRHRFPRDNETVCRQEIEDNRQSLHQWIGRRPDHFCYPSGDWARSQVPWLEEMGVKSATTCDPGLNSNRSSPHALQRILDSEDMHELEFEAALSGFNDLLRRLRPLGWTRQMQPDHAPLRAEKPAPQA
jgi:peptidoglycan/xylan/chitin deacetylase (PgdA/CDA1 family)